MNTVACLFFYQQNVLTEGDYLFKRPMGHIAHLRNSANHISPFCKMKDPNLLEVKSPSHKDALCQVCWNWPSGSWAEDENVKCLQTNGEQDRRMKDNRRSEKLELSAQMN